MIRFNQILLCALIACQQVNAALIPLDSIVAVVDEAVVTQRELDNRINLIKLDFKQTNRRLPGEETLKRQVLEALINDSLLLQQAANRGIKIIDSQLNQAMQTIAKQNNLSLSEYRQALIADGMNYDKYRETVRNELTISTLRRQYSQRNTSISESEVDEFIKQSGNDTSNFEYLISHILIALPDAAAPEQVGKAQDLANQILARLAEGESFDQLANTFSAGDTALQGGDLGWRKKAEIPGLFSTQVAAMTVGEYVGPIRSASGFHIVYLKNRRDLEQVLTRQVRSRHILIKPNELISEDDARNRLIEIRKRILAGEDFAKMARLYSVDYSSGSEGGDIGWREPGSMVSEYENIADQLEAGQISEPFRTQFGWHILEISGRRTIDETAENKRRKIFNQLLQQKQDEVFDLWKRRLRDEAYVVYPGEAA